VWIEAGLLAAVAVWQWVRRQSLKDLGLAIHADTKLVVPLGLFLGTVAALVLSLAGFENRLDPSSPEAEWQRSAAAILLLWARAFAQEIVFRGFVIDRMRAVGQKSSIAVALAALLAATVAFDGTPAGFASTAIQGVGYGILYFAAERNLLLPIAVHGAFETALVFW
jgi:membrane protease YdiL (CAAX protease family)